ncbi:hypothetical protein, partial [Mycobacterium tuberculosis]
MRASPGIGPTSYSRRAVTETVGATRSGNAFGSGGLPAITVSGWGAGAPLGDADRCSVKPSAALPCATRPVP